MNIVIATDRNFALQAAMFLHSLRATHDETEVQILLLHPGLPDSTLSTLREVCGPWALNARTVDESRLRSARLPRRLRPSALFRLSVAELAPEGWTHALYFDVDIVVRRDLTGLWGLRNTIDVAAAVRDEGSPFFGSPKGPPWRALGVPPQAPYFNSGVLLIDLARWAAEDVASRSLEILRAHDLPHADQCAINTVLLGRITPLEPHWNVMSHLYMDHNHLAITEGVVSLERVREEAAVVHYCTSSLRRPWEEGCEHPERDLWWTHHDALRATMDDAAWSSIAAAPKSRRPLSTRILRRLRLRPVTRSHG